MMNCKSWRFALSSFSLLVVSACSVLPAGAQRNPIHVKLTTSISADNPEVPLGESWLARNPRDPNNMIAVSMAFPKDGRWASVMYHTKDGGKSWERVTHGSSKEAYFWGADPVVAFAPDGTAYYSDLEWGSKGATYFDDDLGSHGETLGVYVYRSQDGGRTWGEPIVLAGTDHSCVAVDASKGKYRGRLYVTYTGDLSTSQGARRNVIGIAYSDDGGEKFAQRLLAPPDVNFRDRLRVGPSPTDLLVAPDGTLLLPYINYLGAAGGDSENSPLIQQIWMMTSSDGGRTFSEPHAIATTSFPPGPDAKLRALKVDYWPRFAVDSSSGPNHGRIYAAYEDLSNKRARIVVSNSSDMGQTWAPPVQVNDDRTDADQNTPGLAVSDTGVVGVSWYDRRRDPKANCFQEYFSASLDGGQTFLPNVVVREQPTCTVQPKNWQPNASLSLNATTSTYSLLLVGPALRFMNGGETQGLVALSGGGFHAAWINGESGVMQLASSRVEVTAAPFGEDVGTLLSVKASQPLTDLTAKTISLQVMATNRSSRAFSVPLVLELTQVGSLFEGLRAVNSENGLPGTGAVWHLTTASGKASILRPGESTGTVTLKFGFEKVPEGKIDASLSADFHIFEQLH